MNNRQTDFLKGELTMNQIVTQKMSKCDCDKCKWEAHTPLRLCSGALDPDWGWEYWFKPDLKNTGKLSKLELILLNCGVGEDSWESLGLQGDPMSPS